MSQEEMRMSQPPLCLVSAWGLWEELEGSPDAEVSPKRAHSQSLTAKSLLPAEKLGRTKVLSRRALSSTLPRENELELEKSPHTLPSPPGVIPDLTRPFTG